MDKIIKRHLWSDLVSDLDKERITILLGPRQVGKTTLLLRLIEHLKEKGVDERSIFYYNFDDIDLRSNMKRDFRFIQKDIEKRIGTPIENGSKIYLFLDEGQKSPSVFELVKLFFDKNYPLKCFISGSSSLNIKDKSVETLSGRVHYFYLSPVSFSESIGQDFGLYRHLENINNLQDIKELASFGYRHIEKYQRLFYRLLFLGGLPKIISLKDEDSISYLNDFLSSYLDKDIKDIGAKVDIESFHLSFKYLSSYCADLFNFSKLGEDLGIKRDSLYRYFELLEKTLVVKTVSPFIFLQMKHICKSRKLFFFDNGVVNRLKGFISFEEVVRAQFMGKVFENFIFQNLYSRSLNDLKKPDFYYYRDYQDHEIDFIYQRGGNTIPIEASYTTQISGKKLRNFSRFFSLFPSAQYGIIFYLGEIKKLKVKDKRIFAVPYFLV